MDADQGSDGRRVLFYHPCLQNCHSIWPRRCREGKSSELWDSLSDERLRCDNESPDVENPTMLSGFHGVTCCFPW
jgi:hypothetical protein